MKFNLTKVYVFYGKGLFKTIMKTFIFLFCTVVFSFGPKNGFSQNAKITIYEDSTIPIKAAFRLIKQQTNYLFVYDVNMIKSAPPITLKKGIIKVKDLLEKGLNPINCVYDFEDNIVIVKRKTNLGAVKEVFQQYVKGTIKSADGLPLLVLLY